MAAPQQAPAPPEPPGAPETPAERITPLYMLNAEMIWQSAEEASSQRGTEWLWRLPVGQLLDHRQYAAPYRATRGNREDRAIEKEEKRRAVDVEEWRRKRHNAFSKAIVLAGEEVRRFNRNRRTDAGKCARACKAHLEGISHRAEVAEARASRRRLQALKSNDMEAYSKLLEETKNERLKFLLHRTDSYIRDITERVKEQRSLEERLELKTTHKSEAASARSAAMRPPQLADNKGKNEDEVRAKKNKTAAAAAADSPTEDPTSEYNRVTHEASEEVRQPKMLVGGALKEYQLAGLRWLVSLYNNRLNGILADEMGLGKTIQTIALLAHLMESKSNSGPFLVVAPLSTLSNWAHEFAKWVPSMVVLIYKVGPNVGARSDAFRRSYNAVLTTYEYVMRDRAVLRKVEWEYIVVDEGHRMKNAQSKFAQTLGNQYTAQRRLLLTGTPLQNSLPELWALLNFLLPSIFQSVDTFEGWFNKPFAQFATSSSSSSSNERGVVESSTESTALTHEERMLIINRLHEVLRPFVLRRVKANVLGQLPEKVEKVVRSELSPWQKVLYEQIRSAGASTVAATAPEEAEEDGTTVRRTTGGLQQGGAAPRGLNNVLMQLRKCCNHPYLFRTDAYAIDENLVRASGKFLQLDSMLPKLKAAGHRVLLFSQMTALIDLLEDFFHLRGFSFLRLDGSTASEERERRMAQFNDVASPTFIFLLSTRAGGLGLNLATADTVIIFDSDWNPMMDAQAQDRAHRIGQRHEVRVYRLISASPVEERILARATEKLNVNNLVVEAGKFEQDSNLNDRRKMVEDLLREYDNTDATAGDNNNDDGDDGKRSSSAGTFVDEEHARISETMATSAEELALYNRVDEARRCQGLVLPPLTEDEVPKWVRGQSPAAGAGGDGAGAGDDNAAAAEDDDNDDENPLHRGAKGRSRFKRTDGSLSCADNLSDSQFAKMLDGDTPGAGAGTKKGKRAGGAKKKGGAPAYTALGKPGTMRIRLKRRRTS